MIITNIEIYGTSITIQRKIYQDGATAYRIQSANGEVVSKTREELSMIVDHFCIQVLISSS